LREKLEEKRLCGMRRVPPGPLNQLERGNHRQGFRKRYLRGKEKKTIGKNDQKRRKEK